jgi:hypothetical protein
MGALAGVKRFPLGNCDPTGIAFGPGTDMLIECRPGNKGDALVSLILNRTTGAKLATIPFGGGDQVWYDPTTNRYAVAGSRWHVSGVNDNGGGCSATNLCDPMLGIIDAGTRTLIGALPSGNNAHSVAVDPVTGNVYMPYSISSAPAGARLSEQSPGQFANGGIAVYTIR